MDLTESIDLLKALEAHGASYIIESAGSPSHTLALAHPDRRIPDYAYLHFYFQKVCRDALKPETAVIGSAYSIYRDGKQNFCAVDPKKNTFKFWGNKNIKEGIVDAVAIGRQAFADPYVAAKMMEGKEDEIHWCTLCDNCVELLIRQHYNVGCVTYDKHYTDIYMNMIKTEGKIKYKHT